MQLPLLDAQTDPDRRRRFAAVCLQLREHVEKQLSGVARRRIEMLLRLEGRLMPRGRKKPALPARQDYFAADYDRLLQCPDVASVHPNEVRGAVVVITRTIYRTIRGRIFEIGDFAIQISEDCHISMRNIRNTCADTRLDHPLVIDGNFCLGSVQGPVLDALDYGEIAAAVLLLILFLKEAQLPDDPGCLGGWREIIPGGEVK